MKVTTIDDWGIDLITYFEGFESRPYLCQAGVPTIGYGTTRYPDGRKVTLSDPEITRAQGQLYLVHDISISERAVDAMTTDSVSQNQFNALVSFAYNLGAPTLKGSTLLKKANTNPNDPTIKLEFAKWVYADGKKSKGLIARRAKEAEMYG